MGDKKGVEVFEVTSTGESRRSAMLGGYWYGAELTGYSQPAQFNWTDTNGNGQIDWNSQGSGSDGEVTWFHPLGETSNVSMPWVDDNGNIWAVGPGGIVKIALEGFDAQHNPLYNFANMTLVAPNIDDDYDFHPIQVRVAGNGDIYASGGVIFLLGLEASIFPAVIGWPGTTATATARCSSTHRTRVFPPLPPTRPVARTSLAAIRASTSIGRTCIPTTGLSSLA